MTWAKTRSDEMCPLADDRSTRFRSRVAVGACGWVALGLHTTYILSLVGPSGQRPTIVHLAGGYASVLATYWTINLATQSVRPLQALASLAYLSVYGVLVSYTVVSSKTLDYAVLRENFQLALDPAAKGVILGSLDQKILAGGAIAIVLLLVAERQWRWLTGFRVAAFRLPLLIGCGLTCLGFLLLSQPASDALVGFLRSTYSYYRVDVRGEVLAKHAGPYPLIREAAAATPPLDAPQAPHVFLLMIESFNAKYVEATTEEGRAYTPFFNQLIRQGWYVERFYGNSVQTTKGQFATLFSAIPTLRGKEFVDYGFNRYYSLPQVLRDHGYRTLFFQGQADVDFENTRVFLGRNGFDRCVSVGEVLQPEDDPYVWGWGAEDQVVYRRFFESVDVWLGGDDSPLFALIATIGTHAGSMMPANRRLLYPQPRSAHETYANAIHLSDRQLEVFFRELERRPALRNSIVILTGDHSYPTGDHGITTNEAGHYEESFRTPLLILWPGRLEPRRIAGPYSQLDIAPTVTDLAHVRLTRHHFEGQSLLAGKPAPRVYLVQPYEGGWVGIVDYPLKYATRLHDGWEELFDLAADPGEKHNLIDELAEGERLQALRNAVDRVLLTQHLIRYDRVWDGRGVRRAPWPPARSLVIAHRGNSSVAPENTLAAIEEALDLGAEMVEIDVRLSADGAPVIIHDETVDRTTDGTGKVSELKLAQLQALDAGSWKHPRYSGERIPALIDALRQAGHRGWLLLDIKVEGLGPPIAAAFHAAGIAPSRAVVGTWNEQQTGEFAHHLPGALIVQTGPAPERWPASFFDQARRRGAVGFEVGDAWPAAFVAAARADGMPVYAYTVNDEPTQRRLLALGINGIETDHPGRLRDLRTSVTGGMPYGFRDPAD